LLKRKQFESKILLTLFTLAVSIILAFIIFERFFMHTHSKNLVLNHAELKLQEREETLKNFINNIDNIFHYIERSQIFNHYLHSGDTKELEELLLTIAQTNTSFMQLRYLDANGMEQVRIDRNSSSDTPFVQPPLKLQNKWHRNYFIEAKKAKKLYISRLDLNVEYSKIQIPYQATLRIALPIYQDKNFIGLFIANIFIDNFFKTPIFDMMLINQKGEVILPFESDQEYKLYEPVSQLLPLQYQAILEQKLYRSDDLISQHFDLSNKDGMIVVIKLKEPYKQSIHSSEESTHLSIYAAVALITFVFALLLYLVLRKHAQEYRELIVLNEQLEFSNQELQNANELISNNIDPYLIISQSKTSMILTGNAEQDHKILYVNDAFCKLFGYTQEEVIGKNPRFLTQEDREQKGLKLIREAIHTHRSVTTILRNYTKEGEVKYIELSISPIFEQNSDTLHYFLGIHKDVTREQKLLRELRKMF